MKLVNGMLVSETQADLDQAVADAVPSIEALHTYAAQKRYEIEVGGIVVNGLQVPTDDRAKTLIEGGASTLSDTDEIDFFAPDIGWTKLTGVQIRGMQASIAAHVQACFSKSKEISDKIDNGTIIKTAQIDAEDWPPNS